MRVAILLFSLTICSSLMGCAASSEFMRGFTQEGFKRAIAEGVDIGTKALAEELGEAAGDVDKLKEGVSTLATAGQEPAEERGFWSGLGALLAVTLTSIGGAFVRKKFLKKES